MEHHPRYLWFGCSLELRGLVKRITQNADTEVVEVSPDLVRNTTVDGAIEFSPVFFELSNQKVSFGRFAFFKIDAGAVGSVCINL